MCFTSFNCFKSETNWFPRRKKLTNWVPLITCLIDGVERRFDKLFDGDFMYLAAISDHTLS
jgi:hypothetical protein